MRHIVRASSILGIGLLVACTPAPSITPPVLAETPAVPDVPPVVVTERATATTTASGQPIRLPQGEVRIVLSDYKIAPGARLPVHKHPYPRLAIVQAGTLSVTNQETGETITYAPGDMIVEAVDQWHFGVATGTVPVELLVLDEITGDGSNTILHP